MKTNLIYICGPVSGTDDYVARFARVEKNLRASFDGDVVNPVRLTIKEFEQPEKFPWHYLMHTCLTWLTECTHIYLMHDWQDSYGARIEKLWGEKLNLIEIYEVEKNV